MRRILGRDRLQRLQNLELLVAHRVGIDRDRRLHGDEAEELEHMVLHHVAQCAGGVVVAGPAFESQRLGDRNLHMVDMGTIPDRLEQRIGEAQCHQVLNRLLAEIMVDAEDAVLRKDAADGVVDGRSGFEIAADRLFDHDACPFGHQIVGAETLADRSE